MLGKDVDHDQMLWIGWTRCMDLSRGTIGRSARRNNTTIIRIFVLLLCLISLRVCSNGFRMNDGVDVHLDGLGSR